MYNNYIFDLYGTLVDIHTEEIKRSLWEKLSLFYSFHGADYGPKTLRKEYLSLCRQEEEKLSVSDYPELEITGVFLQLFLNKSVPADAELAREAGRVFRILSLRYIRLYPGVTTLLQELKDRGKKIYLLSNAQRIFTEPEMKLLKLTGYFDGILFSSDEGCKKPSPLFYQALFNRYGLNPKESIMIGNDPIADIAGAHNAGLSALYIHSNLSPELTVPPSCEYSILDGDVTKIGRMLR